MYILFNGNTVRTMNTLEKLIVIIKQLIEVDKVPQQSIHLYQGNEIVPLPYTPPIPPEPLLPDGINTCFGLEFVEGRGSIIKGSRESLHTKTGGGLTELGIRSTLVVGGYSIDFILDFDLQSTNVASVDILFSGRSTTWVAQSILGLSSAKWVQIQYMYLAGSLKTLSIPIVDPKKYITNDGILSLRFFMGQGGSGYYVFYDQIVLDVKYIR